jgi:hypothetical protein
MGEGRQRRDVSRRRIEEAKAQIGLLRHMSKRQVPLSHLEVFQESSDLSEEHAVIISRLRQYSSETSACVF